MKLIDRKYHIENETIIKTSNGVPIPADEPLILFRGKDRLALPMLKAYRQICIDDECTSYQIEAIDVVIQDFEFFKDSHPGAMKQPGSTLGQ